MLAKAINVKKNYAEAYCDIGRYLLDAKEIKCFKLLCQSSRVQAQLIWSLHKYWKYLSEIRESLEAMKYFQKSLEINNKIPITFYNIGTIYAIEKNFIDAERIIKVL